MAHYIHHCNGKSLLITTEESKNLELLAQVYSSATVSLDINLKTSINSFNLYTACPYFIPEWNEKEHVFEAELRSIINQIMKDNGFDKYLVTYFYILHYGT